MQNLQRPYLFRPAADDAQKDAVQAECVRAVCQFADRRRNAAGDTVSLPGCGGQLRQLLHSPFRWQQGRLRVGFDLFQGAGLRQQEPIHPCTQQERHVGCCAERGGNVLQKRADIGALRASDGKPEIRRIPVQKLQFMDDDRARFPFDFDALPGILIQFFAVDL